MRKKMERVTGVEPATNGLGSRIGSNTVPSQATWYYTKQENGNIRTPASIKGIMPLVVPCFMTWYGVTQNTCFGAKCRKK